jgi:GrpB-like predicted nucleotidyltransferase (UPF0157 family)
VNNPTYEVECQRLLSTLGAITEGGKIEQFEPIGSSSVPGLDGSGVLDIGLLVWPYPVDASALAGLGYHALEGPLPGAENQPGIQRFLDENGQVQLWLVSAEETFLDNAVLLRNYLRGKAAARQEFAESVGERAAPGNKAAFFARILPEAQRWWVEQVGFTPLESAAAEFTGAAFPWYISSGWALDLFLGRVTRVHRDVDVVVPYQHQLALQELLLERGWKLLTPLDGCLEPWPRHMQLRLPRHQVHAHREGKFIDLLLSEIEHGVWRYRRDPAVLRSTERMALKSPSGIPYLAPDLVLLFKSKNTSKVERPQDRVDFEQALPFLEPERRAWLRWALTASDPNNAWLESI